MRIARTNAVANAAELLAMLSDNDNDNDNDNDGGGASVAALLHNAPTPMLFDALSTLIGDEPSALTAFDRLFAASSSSSSSSSLSLSRRFVPRFAFLLARRFDVRKQRPDEYDAVVVLNSFLFFCLNYNARIFVSRMATKGDK
jgi:hypothetical protein